VGPTPAEAVGAAVPAARASPARASHTASERLRQSMFLHSNTRGVGGSRFDQCGIG
jgi:hypothetical protein